MVSNQILLEETESLIPLGSQVKDVRLRGHGIVFGYSVGYYEFNPHGGSDDEAWPMVQVNFLSMREMTAVEVKSLEFFVDGVWVNGETLHQRIIVTSEAKGWQR